MLRLTVLFGCLLLAGCGSEEGVVTYTIPTEVPEQLAPGKQRMLGAIVPRGDKVWFFKVMGPEKAVELVDDQFRQFVQGIQFGEDGNPVLEPLPETWRRGGDKPMRFASIDINTPKKQLDLSVSDLPSFGTWDDYVKRNVDRWRGQLSLEPSDEKWSGGQPLDVPAAEGESVWVDLTGEAAAGGGGMMAGGGPFSAGPFSGGGPNSPGPNSPGPMSPGPVASGAAAGGPPSSAIPGAGNLPPATDAAQPKVDFERPDGWRDGRKSMMRWASFEVGGEDAAAEVTVIPALGEVRDNVARWMGQVAGKPPADEEVDKMLADAESLTISGFPAQRFVIEGDPEQGQKSIDATMVPRPGQQTVFIKMTGPPETVAEQSDAMRTFLKSLSF
ncbi:hypothetical protein FYK55_09045 [Roseiconus nitratireducens]|uniref:Lipoprotein n=1 Tax=Roseiconus nitratireducens TaxID=2605748 RepID=A0A5M6DA78_9BACT|nr:hypothetical protein [Roseiconus nitratireducens]KAA5544467.1 hypothetical protein FYK55_09045 [Roseiconus nitratireducens]